MKGGETNLVERKKGNGFKIFSPEDHAMFDEAVKVAIVAWLRLNGYWAEKNDDDRYGIDVFWSKGDKKGAIDGEHKAHWVTDKFPFSTLHIPMRKKKWAKNPNNWLGVTNNNITKIAIVRAVKAIEQTEKKDTTCSWGEEFMSVPTNNFRIYNLKEKVDEDIFGW